LTCFVTKYFVSDTGEIIEVLDEGVVVGRVGEWYHPVRCRELGDPDDDDPDTGVTTALRLVEGQLSLEVDVRVSVRDEDDDPRHVAVQTRTVPRLG